MKMLSKFRGAATRLVVQAFTQNPANPAARFAGKRGSENAHCNNISYVIKEYGSHRLYPNFPDLPRPRLNIPQPIRYYETRAANPTPISTPTPTPIPPPPASPYMPPISPYMPPTSPYMPQWRLPFRAPCVGGSSGAGSSNGSNGSGSGGGGGGKRAPALLPTKGGVPFGEQRRPRVKPTPGPPPRCDPALPKRMLTPRYTAKLIQGTTTMLAFSSLAQMNLSSQDDEEENDLENVMTSNESAAENDMICPEVQKTHDPMPNLPSSNLPYLMTMLKAHYCTKQQNRPEPRIRTDLSPYVDIKICTPYTFCPDMPAECYQNYYDEEGVPRRRKHRRLHRVKGC